MGNKFTITVAEDSFVILKVFEDVDFYLYVLPNDKAKNGFFMTKNSAGSWEISNKVLVANVILDIEQQIAETIRQELK